jgi:hypothetical protein
MAAEKLTRTKAGKLPATVKKAIVGGKFSLDTGILLQDIIEAWGGPHRLAASMKEEFANAAPGSMVRTRTLEMIQRLVVQCTANEMTNVRKPADLSNEELEEEARRLIERLTKAKDGHAKEAEVENAD